MHDHGAEAAVDAADDVEIVRDVGPLETGLLDAVPPSDAPREAAREGGLDATPPFDDADLDALSPAEARATLDADCLQLCSALDAYPRCVPDFDGLDCADWCAKDPEAGFGRCRNEASNYFRCVLTPGNLVGCSDAGSFLIGVCTAEQSAVNECIHG